MTWIVPVKIGLYLFVCVCFSSFENFINEDFVYVHVVSFLPIISFYCILHNKNAAVEIYFG